ncbi:MAG TPA: NADP-dependent phosphogluconate dehydrogenase [Candidatus Saccharimonadales bacterium]|nr:NADP-dependent phosphogluconate dehydrogenase [Candidatus Saccharimonadales bacterium]
MKIAIAGLGKMGGRMAEKLIKDGQEVAVWNRTHEKAEALAARLSDYKNLSVAGSIEELVRSLETPRVVLTMLPEGAPTELLLTEISGLLDKGDILIDAGNSHYKDTERHFRELESKGIRFLGIGISGGIIAATEGYPQMVGGDKSAYEYVTPILDSLAKPSGGHEYFGPGGAGHFVKMVHNGIEYPIMQALGEGFGVLANSDYDFDLVKVAKLYQQGTLVSGFMLDRAVEALQADPGLEKVAGVIGSASPEAVWTIEEAKRNNLPVESIEQARNFRLRSETEKYVQASFAARMVGALRIAFGGHPVKLKDDK